MEKIIYAFGLAFRGVTDMWDNIANFMILGFNQIPLENILHEDDDVEYFEDSQDDPDP